jgi:ABC-type microcin C transport system permease subunit YejB
MSDKLISLQVTLQFNLLLVWFTSVLAAETVYCKIKWCLYGTESEVIMDYFKIIHKNLLKKDYKSTIWIRTDIRGKHNFEQLCLCGISLKYNICMKHYCYSLPCGLQKAVPINSHFWTLYTTSLLIHPRL